MYVYICICVHRALSPGFGPMFHVSVCLYTNICLYIYKHVRVCMYVWCVDVYVCK